MHELNFMSVVDPQKLPGHIVTDILAGDLFSHLHYNHLFSAVVPANKLKEIQLGDLEVADTTISKQGHPKGAKTKKDSSKNFGQGVK